MVPHGAATSRLLAAILAAAVSGSPAMPPGTTAASWRVLGTGVTDYDVSLDSSVAHGGHASVRIASRVAEPYGSASIAQQVRADAWRGRRVRFSGYLKGQDVEGDGGGITIGVVSSAGVTAQRTLDTAPILGSTGWRAVRADVDVPSTAAGINLTVTLNGAGTLWVDDLRLEVAGTAAAVPAPPAPPPRPMPAADTMALVGPFASAPVVAQGLDFEQALLEQPPARSPLESPRPFRGRGLENMIAFARLFGVVRHFHPTEAVRTANWDDLAIRGVRAVESAPSADSLARTLQAFFAGVAPTVRVFASGDSPEPSVAADTATDGQRGGDVDERRHHAHPAAPGDVRDLHEHARGPPCVDPQSAAVAWRPRRRRERHGAAWPRGGDSPLGLAALPAGAAGPGNRGGDT